MKETIKSFGIVLGLFVLSLLLITGIIAYAKFVMIGWLGL